MGRKREYKKEITEDEYIKIVASKVYKEILTPKQMAAYLSEKSRGKIHFSERKVRDRIEDICNLSNGLMKVDDFKLKTGRNEYQFKPEWHGLLFALMDTEYFDNRKNDRLLGTRESFYRDIVKNIEFYLKEEDKEIIESFPGYINAKCECIMSEAINYQIQDLIRDAMNSDETIRLRLLKRIHDSLNELIEVNYRENSRMIASKMVYKYTFDGKEDGKFISAMFCAEKLPVFMAELLALKVNGKKFNDISNVEQLKYKSIYANANIDDPIPLPEKNEFIAFISQINNKAELNNDFQNLIVRLYNVMNMENPIEKELLIDFFNIARSKFIASEINDEELDKSKKYFEAAMQRDIYDLLDEFVNGDWKTPTIIELNRIKKQETLVKSKIESEMKNNSEN